jgi:hypothetical protein
MPAVGRHKKIALVSEVLTSRRPWLFPALRPKYFFLFFLRAKAQSRKEIVAHRNDFRRPWRLGVFARHILFFSSRKAAELRGPVPQNCGAPDIFFLLSSRKACLRQAGF